MAKVTIGTYLASDIGHGATGIRIGGADHEVEIGHMGAERIEGIALDIQEAAPAPERSKPSRLKQFALDLLCGVSTAAISSRFGW